MRRPSRTTSLALAGLLALGGAAGCQRDAGTGGESNLEGDPVGPGDVEQQVDPPVDEQDD